MSLKHMSLKRNISADILYGFYCWTTLMVRNSAHKASAPWSSRSLTIRIFPLPIKCPTSLHIHDHPNFPLLHHLSIINNLLKTFGEKYKCTWPKTRKYTFPQAFDQKWVLNLINTDILSRRFLWWKVITITIIKRQHIEPGNYLRRVISFFLFLFFW